MLRRDLVSSARHIKKHIVQKKKKDNKTKDLTTEVFCLN